MEPNWAAEHLHVIRTLMERAAIYRRALAPIMLLLGILGLVAAAAGWFFRIESTSGFGWCWIAVSLVGVSGAYLMVRRQALKDAEPFWSPPTRRVTQAVLPPLFVGLTASVSLIFLRAGDPSGTRWLPPVWMVLYGCALHAAGFFMPRGMKLFGWIFILSGCGLGAGLVSIGNDSSWLNSNFMMGGTFGGLHLTYGIYLYFTEPRKNET